MYTTIKRNFLLWELEQECHLDLQGLERKERTLQKSSSEKKETLEQIALDKTGQLRRNSKLKRAGELLGPLTV